VDVHHLESKFLKTTRRITVMRPRFRDATVPRGPVPVLYLNDGQNLFDPARAFAGNTWRAAETVNRLVRQHLIPPLLVVGIDHGQLRRAREYLPVDDERNPLARKPLGRQYVDFVVREVVPFVEQTYRVRRSTAARAFGGSSYGAVAALLTVLERPGVFGRLLIESPSLYVGGRLLLRKARRATRSRTCAPSSPSCVMRVSARDGSRSSSRREPLTRRVPGRAGCRKLSPFCSAAASFRLKAEATNRDSTNRDSTIEICGFRL
jgi:predicted alpha/beta superfamily hydrolase